ncbi:MAG: long-chain fatty acid--CoA ligase [Planctomycetia bacterium]|nr:long-chain fatty acid--CoA ligase [Planctomycetia bacterium]
MTTNPPNSIVALLAKRLKESSDRPAIWVKSGEWRSRSWHEVGEDVARMASWLISRGIERGDCVAQLSENRYDWLIADLAMHVTGAVHVPIHAPLTGEQAAFQIRDSGARLVLVSTPSQLEKLVGQSEGLPRDLQVYSYEKCDMSIGTRQCKLVSEELPDYDLSSANTMFRAAISATYGDTLATILYTSGTTGEPKGVMLSNRNLVSNALAATEPFAQGPDDLRLSFLPLSHIFARTCDLYTWLASGSQLALAESRETVIADCLEMRPTVMNGVPYFYEKVMNALAAVDFTSTPNALRDLLGGRIRCCCSGGAALPMHVFDFFTAHGVPLLQGYGLTESSPVITLSSEQNVKRGAVGQAIPAVEVRIADDGEILTRGPHVMLGYFKNQLATDEVVRDGWLHTGDIGHLDDEGYLFITGRKKELIVTSGGKNIAPVYLESLLTQDPLITQAVVIGDDRKYLVALIVPELAGLEAEMATRGITLRGTADDLQRDEVCRLFEERIAARLACVSHYEQVRKFTLLDRGFTIESGELTAKLTLRRETIHAKCHQLIDAMYAPE